MSKKKRLNIFQPSLMVQSTEGDHYVVQADRSLRPERPGERAEHASQPEIPVVDLTAYKES